MTSATPALAALSRSTRSFFVRITIADSLDLESPAITDLQQEELMSIQMLAASPLDQGRKIGGRLTPVSAAQQPLPGTACSGAH